MTTIVRMFVCRECRHFRNLTKEGYNYRPDRWKCEHCEAPMVYTIVPKTYFEYLAICGKLGRKKENG